MVLAQDAASSYNPFGTGPEHAEDVASVVDGDINTSWSTEHYVAGSLGKPGLGISIDASPGVAARAVEIQTPTPGFSASVYASTRAPSSTPAAGDRASRRSAGPTRDCPHDRLANEDPGRRRKARLSLLPGLDDQAAARTRDGGDFGDHAVQVDLKAAPRRTARPRRA